MNENLKLIFDYVSVCLSLLIFLCSLVASIIYHINKKRKINDACYNDVELQEDLDYEKARNKLLNEIIPNAMEKAEATPLVNGATKKLLAMSEILISCNALGIDFAYFKQFIEEEIEKLITFSKTINKR